MCEYYYRSIDFGQLPLQSCATCVVVGNWWSFCYFGIGNYFSGAKKIYMSPTLQRLLVIIVCIIALTVPRAMQACTVCIELPETSIADHILSAKVIVFARPSPENPFKFSAHRFVKGSSKEFESLPEIPFLVDSVTRREFRSDPTTTVLLTYGPKFNDKAGRGISWGWRRIFTMNRDRNTFLERLQTIGRFWAHGETDNPERVLFFAEYLWHADTALHNVALVEVDRAPYKLVRAIGGSFSTSRILSELNDLNRFAYRPVTIRLLGLQTDSHARSVVRSRYIKSLKSGGLNLYDWALAGVEAEEMQAINAIDLALQDPRKSAEEKSSLIRALTGAGSFLENLRPEIAQILSSVLERDREFALQIAAATRNWEPSVLHQQFETLVALEETDLPTQYILNIALGAEIAVE